MRKSPGYTSKSQALEATQVFCLAKHQFALLNNNLDVADWALETALSEMEAHAPPLRMTLRVTKVCIQHGAGILAQRAQATGVADDDDRARLLETAVRWLRRSVTVLERVEGGTLPQVQELQIEALRKLASAYYEHATSPTTTKEETRQDALTRADTTLNELLGILRQHGSQIEDLESITLTRLEISAQRKSPAKSLLDLIKKVCQRVDSLNERAVSRIMTVLRSRDESLEFIEQAVQTVLAKLLEAPNQPDDLIHIVLHSTLALCKTTPMLSVAHSMLDKLAGACFTASKDASFAAQLMLWKAADSFEARDSDRLIAAAYYRLASHKVFSLADGNVARSIRKAALVHLEAGQPSQARELLLTLPTPHNDHATAHYLLFVSYARDADEQNALASLSALFSCPDFESSMLPAIVTVAQEMGLQSVLYQAMRGLSERARTDKDIAKSVDPIVLTRCLVKHALPPSYLDDGSGGASYTQDDALTLLSHLDNLLHALRNCDADNRKACREAEWAYKASYNAAISISQHVKGFDWETSAQLFDMVLAIAKLRQTFTAFPIGSGDDAGAGRDGAGEDALSFHKAKVWIKLSSIIARASAVRSDEQAHADAAGRNGASLVSANTEQALRIMWFKVKDEVDEGFSLLTEVRSLAATPVAPTHDENGSPLQQQQQPPSSMLREVEWALILIQYEAVVKLQDWPAAQRIFKERAAATAAAVMAASTAGGGLQQPQVQIPVRIFETMADLAMSDPRAPDELLADVLLATIETIKANASANAMGQHAAHGHGHGHLDVPRLAKWVRFLVMLYLNRALCGRDSTSANGNASSGSGGGGGRQRGTMTSLRQRQEEALRHIEAAVETMSILADAAASGQGQGEWPADEQAWILAMAWDMGIELFQ